MLFNLSNLNSNLALTLGYLNPALNNSALGARDFSSAVSSFCQALIVTRAKRFFSLLRLTAEDMSTFD